MKALKKCIISLLLCLFVGHSAFAKSDLILATATTGGTYYPVGVAIATLTSVKLASKQKITMTAITSAGSGENVQLLKNKEADLAILQGLFGAMAWQGKGKYDGNPHKDMRAITMLWENVEHQVIKSDYVKSGNISDLMNIKGEKYSIGKRGSGTEGSGRVILAGLQFQPDQDFSLVYQGYGPSAKSLQNGKIVGMNIPAGPPVSAITQAFANIGSDKIRVLDFTDEQLMKVNQTFSVWSRYVIAPGTYPGQDKAINTIAQPNFLAVHPDVDEEVVYQLVKTIYENLPFLHNIHKATKALSLERAINGLPVPLHPGAIRFYKEQGLMIPEKLMASK